MKNNSLIVKEDTIIEKIKTFFRKLFYKPTYAEENIDNNNIINEIQQEKNEFDEKIIIKEDPEEKRICMLQNQIESEEINLDQISDDDFDKIVLLYKNQIDELKESTRIYNESTESYRKKIIEIRNYAS